MGRQRRLFPGACLVFGDLDAGSLEQLEEQVDGFVIRHRERRPEVGQPFADRALGRVDEQDRGFEAALPIDQGETSAYIAPDGSVVVPEGVELPRIVPFERPE